MVEYPPRSVRQPDVMQERTTATGRNLCYWLSVIQQPERARACGSGAKSSADRRPVDPPPVVELRIWEGVGDNREDVTFAYSANFFLFATLEMSRPMAHGRVQPAQQPIPVLTGMPVSGMAYLDRPTEAGYFIFPDLSVRHEGKYKLSFNLYEQTHTKDDKDAEPSPLQDSKAQIPGPNTPESSFDWRMEVKSNQFTVYSAKKFPGLAESTNLSRTVAEQGCRVRIRRDVRMRRRDDKSNRDYEQDLAEDDYIRSQERSRSLSSEREEQRPGGNLNFGQAYTSGPQFATPMPPSNYPQPAQYSHPPAPPQYRAPVPAQQPLQPLNYGERPYGYAPHSAYPSTTPREREYEAEYRRSSYPTSGLHSGPYPAPLETGYSRHPTGYTGLTPQSPVAHTLPPLKMRTFDGPQPSPPGMLQSNSSSKIVPDLSSPVYERYQDRYAQPSMPIPASSEMPRGSKRSFEQFMPSAARQDESLYNHARPSSSHQNQGFADEDEFNTTQMTYKRAGGEISTRELPQAE